MTGDRDLQVAQTAFVMLLLAGSATALTAQPVVDPPFVDVGPWADHDTVAAGTPLARRTGAQTLRGSAFTATQGGGCTFSLSQSSMSVTASGGSGFTSITGAAGCPWSATSNATWITVTSPASGSGNGSLAFDVGANPNASARTGTLTIASQTFTVSQAAAPCTYGLIPTSQSMIAGGGSSSTSVITPGGCAWTAVNNTGVWLTITGPTSGTGSAVVTFTAAANSSQQPRTGTLTIGGQTFTLNQAASPCFYSLSPASQAVVSAGGGTSTTVTTLAGCAWTAVSNNPTWLTITSGASGTGTGSVSVAVAANTATAQRIGTLTAAGRTFTVTQAASSGCTYALTPASQTMTAPGGTGSFAVGTSSGCAWSATTSQSWISVSGTGTGPGAVSYTVQPNTGTSSRTGAISTGGQVFSIAQSGVSTTPPAAPQGFRIVMPGGD